MGKLLFTIISLLASLSLSAPLAKCSFSTYIEEQYYGMVHFVEVPHGECQYLGGFMERLSSKECILLVERANGQCYQLTKTKIFTQGQYVGKLYNCWGCLNKAN